MSTADAVLPVLRCARLVLSRFAAGSSPVLP